MRNLVCVAQGCRVPAVEGLLLSQTTPKKIILVLNKIDLVPAEVVRQVCVCVCVQAYSSFQSLCEVSRPRSPCPRALRMTGLSLSATCLSAFVLDSE